MGYFSCTSALTIKRGTRKENSYWIQLCINNLQVCIVNL